MYLEEWFPPAANHLVTAILPQPDSPMRIVVYDLVTFLTNTIQIFSTVYKTGCTLLRLILKFLYSQAIPSYTLHLLASTKPHYSQTKDLGFSNNLDALYHPHTFCHIFVPLMTIFVYFYFCRSGSAISELIFFFEECRIAAQCTGFCVPGFKSFIVFFL